MCGIAGVYAPNADHESVATVEAMCRCLVHRGPDGSGIVKKGSMVFGHQRLAVIDLSDRATQPMTTADGRFTITYNGEIYNFPEIRRELEKTGIQFHSDSDTEVVLQGYAVFGRKILPKLNGMFAFAIWDNEESELFLARDRFGKKPLYYYRYPGGGLAFASEITALKEDKRIPFELSPEGINCYLSLGYILNPLSMYRDIMLLEPASWMTVSQLGKKLTSGRFWNYADGFREKTRENEEEIADRLLVLLQDAVRCRMISDVPVGAYLSGGVDSSSIVKTMKQYHRGELHTFSVGFPQRSYSELEDADRAAREIGTTHHNLICGDENPLAMVANAVDAFDQVFGDNSLIPTVEVSRLARQHVTVVLSGDGADELFAGYITYKADHYLNFARHLPFFLRRIFARRYKVFSSKKLDFRYKFQQFFYGSLFDYSKAHYLWRIIFTPEERIAILGEKYRDLVYDTDPMHRFKQYYDAVPDLAPLDQHLYVDGMTWLTDDILAKVDRASMKSSLEVRVPYLDFRIAEYAARIPTHIKLRRRQGKYILKQALKKLLPREILKKRKSGFLAPVGMWLPPMGNNEFQTFNHYVLEKKIPGKELKGFFKP